MAAKASLRLAGQFVNAQPASLTVRHGEDVLVHRRAGIGLCGEPVETGGDHRGEREVRVARRVGHAQLDAGPLPASRRDTHQRGAVALGPDDVGRRLVARHQAFVGIDQRVRDRAHALGVRQQSGDVAAPQRRQVEFLAGLRGTHSRRP